MATRYVDANKLIRELRIHGWNSWWTKDTVIIGDQLRKETTIPTVKIRELEMVKVEDLVKTLGNTYRIADKHDKVELGSVFYTISLEVVNINKAQRCTIN